MPDPNLPLLEDAVRKLAPFLDEIVFVGGVTLGLLITDSISKSAVQSLYRHCLELPELQPSDCPASCTSTLKRSCIIPHSSRHMRQVLGLFFNAECASPISQALTLFTFGKIDTRKCVEP